MKIAVCQMASTNDPWENLAMIQSFVEESAESGASFICFPENAFFRGPKRRSGFAIQDIHLDLSPDKKIVAESEFSIAVRDWANQLTTSVSLGSVMERSIDPDRPYNSHWIIEPKGYVTSYRKVHLFRLTSSKVNYDESRDITAGLDPITHRVENFHFGLSICYDLRFPELYRIYSLQKKVEALLVPSSFTATTGEVHWHTLLRARAIENLCYVIAPGQWGTYQDDLGQICKTYGHSLVYDPWGNLIVEAPERGDGLLYLELDIQEVRRRRRQLPALESAVF